MGGKQVQHSPVFPWLAWKGPGTGKNGETPASLAMIRTTTSPACNGMTTTGTAATRLCGTACRSVLVPSIDDPYQVNGKPRTGGLCTETYIQV
jgi:hypothetical protein